MLPLRRSIHSPTQTSSFETSSFSSFCSSSSSLLPSSQRVGHPHRSPPMTHWTGLSWIGRMRVTKADFTSAREKVRQLCHIWLSVLTRFPGVVQEERGHSGRTLPVICIVLSLSCICYSPSSLRISQRVRPPEGCQHRSVCPLPGTARLQKVESDNEKHNTGRRRW